VVVGRWPLVHAHAGAPQTAQHVPAQVTGLSSVTAVTAGQMYSLAAKADGTVWAWGYGGYGSLGIGPLNGTEYYYSPIQVPSLTGVTALEAGYFHSLAVKSDGTLWAWGDNVYGQVGDGTTTRRYAPVRVGTLTGVAAVAAGYAHTLALRTDGTVWAWGRNDSGQLGDGTTTHRSTPVQVAGLTGVVAVAAGDNHSLAVKSDGTLWVWGYNGYGQLGDGTTTARSTPVRVTALSGVAGVAAGESHSLAVKSDGTVWAWAAARRARWAAGRTPPARRRSR
jgi:alpha-tubulin suppressor-like RCC1 family protein